MPLEDDRAPAIHSRSGGQALDQYWTQLYRQGGGGSIESHTLCDRLGRKVTSEDRRARFSVVGVGNVLPFITDVGALEKNFAEAWNDGSCWKISAQGTCRPCLRRACLYMSSRRPPSEVEEARARDGRNGISTFLTVQCSGTGTKRYKALCHGACHCRGTATLLLQE